MNVQEINDRLRLTVAESEQFKRNDRHKQFKGSMESLDEKRKRKWLCQRGKEHVLPFSDKEIKKLRECF